MGFYNGTPLDLQDGGNDGGDFRYTNWTPPLREMGLAFATCLECGATIMYWYDEFDRADYVAVERHAAFHRGLRGDES